MHLFACPKCPTSSVSNMIHLYFTMYTFHQTKLHSSVMFTTLVLLQRLKAIFPTAHSLSGHHLFTSPFMFTSQAICDSTFSKESKFVWSSVQACSSLGRSTRWSMRCDWELNVELGTIKNLEDMVHKDFASPRPYPTYVLQTILKLTATSTDPFSTVTPNNSTSPIPSFVPRHASPPKPTPSPPQIHHHQNPQLVYISPPSMSASPSAPTCMAATCLLIAHKGNPLCPISSQGNCVTVVD